MNRSGEACGFSMDSKSSPLGYAGRYRDNIMPDYPDMSIDDVKRRLISGMISYMEPDDEEPSEDFDCGYTMSDVDRCSSTIDAFLEDVRNKPGDAAIIASIQKTVLELNELNNICGGSLIETDQREGICQIILMAAKQNGLTTIDDVTEEWREW